MWREAKLWIQRVWYLAVFQLCVCYTLKRVLIFIDLQNLVPDHRSVQELLLCQSSFTGYFRSITSKLTVPSFQWGKFTVAAYDRCFLYVKYSVFENLLCEKAHAKSCTSTCNLIYNRNLEQPQTIVTVMTWPSVACVPTVFLILPNFNLCFFNSVETQKMFSIS